MKTLAATLAAIACLSSGTVLAQERPSSGTTWIGEVSVAGGGDTLATLYFTDGSSQDIDAGNGVTFSVGMLQHLSRDYGIKYAIGWKGSWSAANNLDVQKSSIPIDIVPYYRSGQHRFGAGLAYHVSPELYIETLGTSEFDNASGYIVEYGYAGFTLAYTGIDYSIGGVDFDASNIGLRYTFGF